MPRERSVGDIQMGCELVHVHAVPVFQQNVDDLDPDIGAERFKQIQALRQ
jgi:hypothetical protein